MLNFYPFTLANSHVMLLLTAAITHGITEVPRAYQPGLKTFNQLTHSIMTSQRSLGPTN